MISGNSTLKYPIFLAIFSLFFNSCEPDIAKIAIITAKDSLPAAVSKKITILYSDSGLIKSKIASEEMLQYVSNNPTLEFPLGVHAVFYDDEMNVQSELTCKYAIRYENERKMEARSDVVVINEKGEKLNTEHLVWDENEEKIYSDNFVKITTAEEIIYGNGFESNQNFTKYKIFNIKGTISIKNE